MLKWLKKERKNILAAVVLGFVFTAGFALYSKEFSDTMQSGIAEGFVRFHVLANSNSEEDQRLKLLVRDAILAEYREGLETAESKDATREYLTANLENIKDSAERVINDCGYAYSAEVSISEDFFPTKTYGDIRLPAGNYEALRVEIGNGEGNNWWCVMFPPLCYVDITTGELPEEKKNEVRNLLTEQEYELVSLTEQTDKVQVKVKFKIVEWWQERQAGKDKPVGRYAKNTADDTQVADAADIVGQ